MSMERVRNTYRVPARRGMAVEIHGCDGDLGVRRGRITSASASGHIIVDRLKYHPTWNIVYLDDDGNVLLDTRKAKP